MVYVYSIVCKESTGLNNGEQFDFIIVGQYFV